MTQLEHLLIQEWNKIELPVLEKLVDSVPSRLYECIKMKGYPTKNTNCHSFMNISYFFLSVWIIFRSKISTCLSSIFIQTEIGRYPKPKITAYILGIIY